MKRHDRVGALLAISLILATVTTLSGCKTLHVPDVSMPKLRWPFSAKPVPPLVPVDEVIFESPGAPADASAAPTTDAPVAVAPVVAFPQYFKRNTLIIDLTSASGAGSVQMRAKTPAGWPMRIAFRVKPGSFEAIEVRADQRVLLPLVASATRPTQDLALPPGSYHVQTPSMQLRWGPAVPPAPVAPAVVPAAPPAEPAVQSPPTS